MKRHSVQRILSATLAVGLLAGSAFAAPVQTIPLVTAPGVEAPAFTVTPRIATPVQVWGSIKELGENSIYLENSNENDPYNQISLNISPDTLVLDAVTGAKKAFSDLKADEVVYAYVGAAMTRSLPPIAQAQVVLCNIPADYAVPTYCEVETVTVGEDGKISLLTDRDVILHLDKDTEYLTLGAESATDKAVDPATITPGTRVLAWYRVAALSLPAQATPTKLMVFPYAYESYLTLSETGVTVDGDMVVEGLVSEGKLLLPLRTMAEVLGCTVTWDNPNQAVTISKGETVLYTLTIGGEVAQQGEGGQALTVAPKLVGGVTHVAVDDLITLHNLKLSQ